MAKRDEKPELELDPLLVRAIERLRQVMAERGIQQIDLAKMSGVGQDQVSRILRSLRPEANFVQVAKMAIALDVSIDWLVSDAPRFIGHRPDSEAPRPGPGRRLPQ